MITAEALIDCNALGHNRRVLQSYCPKSELVAVIKGDAYGHGAVKIAQTLRDISLFAVSRIEEAIELREAGVSQPILLLEGCFCLEDLRIASVQNFQTVVHHPEQLSQFEAGALSKPIKTWLKLDTGMHRLGITADQVAGYVSRLEATGNVAGDVGFVSHFSCADTLPSANAVDISGEVTTKQRARFEAATQGYLGVRSIANSAGILYWPESHLDYVRAGIALYGIAPNSEQVGKQYGLKPVMTLRSKLIAIRDHQAGQPVGYGETWFADQATKIGVVALGYGDGYPRLAPTGTPVWLNGRLVPIVGRVSMDMITVDLSSQSEDRVGDTVEFWGDKLPIEQVANHIGTIPYELTIKLTKRVVKTFI